MHAWARAHTAQAHAQAHAPHAYAHAHAHAQVYVRVEVAVIMRRCDARANGADDKWLLMNRGPRDLFRNEINASVVARVGRMGEDARLQDGFPRVVTLEET